MLRRVLTVALVAVAMFELVLGFAPFAFWALAFAVATRVYLQTGRWPVYGRDRDLELPPGLLGHAFSAVQILLPLTLVCLFGGFCVWLLLRKCPRKSWLLVSTSCCISLWLAWLGFAALDPGGVLDWFLD